LNQTKHQLVFQQLPLIDSREDFMILFDMDTHSRWKRQPFDAAMIREQTQVFVHPLPIGFTRIGVPTAPATKKKYERERERLFTNLGSKDPHTVPRNLYLLGGRDKLAYIQAGRQPSLFETFSTRGPYVARNKRLGHPDIVPYHEVQTETAYTILEFPHRFIDFCDFVRRTNQAQSTVLVADLKVEEWYYRRYADWSERIHAVYTSLLAK
jgi:hypothetical protein